MSRFIAILGCLVCLFVPDDADAMQGQRRSVTIGFVADGPWERHADLTELVRGEIRDLLSSDFDVRMPADKYIEADWTLAGVESAFDRLLADPEVDFVVTLGTISSHVAAGRRDLPKPVITPLVINAELQGLPSEGGGSGVQNLTYIALPEERDLEVFREVVSFTRVAALVSGPLAEAIPELSERLRVGGEELGLEPTIIPVRLTIDSALEALDAADVEAVYVLPQLQLTQEDWERLVRGLIERRLPSFSWMGRREVEEGILAGRRPDRFFQRVARRVALNIQRILLGEDPGAIQTAFAAQERLAINMATARAIGHYPPFRVMTEAEQLDVEERPAAREVSLTSAMRDAVVANLDLAAREREVTAGAEVVNLSRSVLLPRIDLGANWRIINQDRAESGLGFQPERALSGEATLTQLIYDDDAWTNHSVQKSVQGAREYDRVTLQLDVALEAAVAYLNVLKAKTFERIERDNLSVTRENLELAEIRQSIGTANPGEVYRWQSEIANDRQAVIGANVQKNQAEIQLNRVLHRPLEESFETVEVDISDPDLLSSQRRLFPYIDDLWTFRQFRRFMAQEALAAAPELKAVESLIAAERRTLKNAGRAFWLPTLGLQASVSDIFNAAGAGSEPAPGFESAADLTWSVGVFAQYPLFNGAGRVAERGRAAEAVAQLELERAALAERVEQRARTALHQMGGSNANIRLSAEAAEAARNNLRLVRDSYSRGLASIVELLDAQNSALVAEQAAANAVYDFLIDLLSMERAVGRFYLFAGAEGREAFFRRLEAYFEEAGDPQLQ